MERFREEGGEVSRGGSTHSSGLQPLQGALAHEDVSCGSLSALNCSIPVSAALDKRTCRFTYPLNELLFRLAKRGVRIKQRDESSQRGKDGAWSGRLHRNLSGERPGSKPRRPWSNGSFCISPTSARKLSHLRPEAFPFPRRVTHSKAYEKDSKICTTTFRCPGLRTWDCPGSGGWD